MAANGEICQLCHTEQFRYTCPKCNILYCSLTCYKSPEHLKCSEEFYKDCIQEELTTTEPNAREDMHKIYAILRRIQEADAGLQPDFADAGFEDALDSDDDQPDDAENMGTSADMQDEEVEDDEEDIAVRLQNVDLNDADEVWEHLTASERAEFQQMVQCGRIMQLLPCYKPWWCKEKPSKIVELPAIKEPKNGGNGCMPEIKGNIPNFSSICQKQPAACLHYNLWNIMAAYACVVRFFNGDQLTNASEAVTHLVNLSTVLKFGTNFEDAEDAIISAEMEALTTGNVATGAASATPGVTILLVENREQLQADARQLMSSSCNKLAALSEILQLLELAKERMKQAKREHADFQKLFAVCNGSIELDRAKLKHLVKKIEFMLSYVNRENENRER